MAKKRKRSEGDKAELSMTPMIDVVFLLIIFFMIITELTQQDLAHLELPKASEAQPDKEPDSERLVINVVRFDGPPYYNYIVRTKVYTPQQLIDVLKWKAKQKWNDKRNLSESFILIRADRRVHYRWVQQIMYLCCEPKHNIRIYKIQIAIKKKKP